MVPMTATVPTVPTVFIGVDGVAAGVDVAGTSVGGRCGGAVA